MKNSLSFKELRAVVLGTILVNFIIQKIFRVNSKASFMVHYTSRISMAQNIHIEEHKESSTVYSSLASSNGLYMNGANGINIAKNVMIASGVKIISANHDFRKRNKQAKSNCINIEENVWLGANVIILPGVTIGKNSVIGAGGVVTKDIQKNVVAVGAPAVVIREL